MPDKKSYPLRINPDILTAMKRWSDDELRSVNAQIEYVLRDALRRQGRLKEIPAKPVEVPEMPDAKKGKSARKGRKKS